MDSTHPCAAWINIQPDGTHSLCEGRTSRIYCPEHERVLTPPRMVGRPAGYEPPRLSDDDA